MSFIIFLSPPTLSAPRLVRRRGRFYRPACLLLNCSTHTKLRLSFFVTFRSQAVTRKTENTKIVKISVWNISSETISRYTAVKLEMGNMKLKGEIFIVKKSQGQKILKLSRFLCGTFPLKLFHNILL